MSAAAPPVSPSSGPPVRVSGPDQADWNSITAVIVGIGAFALSGGVTYPLLAVLMEARGLSSTMIGLNSASLAVGVALATLLMPRMTARLAPRALIVVSLAAASVLLAGFMLTDNIAVWFLLRFGIGFCVNTIFTLGEAWLNIATPDRIRGRVTGVYGAVICIGFVLGPLAIPVFGTADSLAFGVCAGMVAAIAMGFGVLARRARVAPAPASAGGAIRFIRLAPLLCLFVMGFGLIDSTSLALFPVYVLNSGGSSDQAAIAVAVMHGGMILAQPLLGIAMDRWSRHGAATSCAIVGALCAAALLWVDPTTVAAWPLLIGLGGAGFGLYTSALAILGERHQGADLTSGGSAFAFVWSIGGMIGPLAIGGAMEASGASALPAVFAAVFLVLAALMMARARE